MSLPLCQDHIILNQTRGFYSDESLAPVPRFCVANGCGRVIFPQPFQRESDLCDACMSRIRPYPLSIANDRVYGDASQFLVLTPSGEFPHELHGNTFREPGRSYVPLAPSVMRSGHPPIRHTPPSFYIQQPTPYIQVQTLDSNRMGSTYRPGVFAGTSQHVSDRNVLSNTGYSATGHPHNDRRPTLQLYPLNCEKCRVFMSNHLVGDGRVCSRCLFQNPARKPAVSAKPPTPFMNPDSFSHKNLIDLTGDDGDGHALMTDTASDVNTPPNRIELRPPFPQQESSSPPSKRQRRDEGVRNTSTQSDRNADHLAIPAEGNVSKLCSTPSCGQTIPIESCSNRCISCVKLDWKLIKDRFKPSGSYHKRGAGNTLPSALAKSTKVKSTKSVTWSDMVTVASEDGTTIQCLARVEEDRLSVSGDNEQDGEGVNTPTAARMVDTTGDEMDVFPCRTVETQEVRLAPLEKPIASITGWDSDLSELSESNESDSPGDSPQISVPTGLKIRIPARSSIFCSRKCRNPMCSQVLAVNYSAKTCMMCRFHHRQIQHSRKGLHDEEDITMDGEPPKFIPDARLCSASGCTHFIPPQQEYKFQRCSLCRLYQEERRLSRQQSDSTKPGALAVDVKEIYKSFRFLPVRFPTPGRCPNLDCGLFHEDGGTSCQQCVSRRAKLMKKAGIQEEHRGVTVKLDRPPRELNIYPQYLCHSFLVSEFEGRLKAFLKSQTVFFLLRVHHPLLVGQTLFSFDGEYSFVALDFDVVGRKTEIDVRALKTKKGLEGIQGLKFMQKRLISVLEGGGVAIRFLCTYQASILRPIVDKSVMSVTEAMKPMTGELEIAVFPDHSHRCLPGEKTIIRFRLLG